MYLPCKAMQPGIGLIGAKSTPIIRLDIGMCSLATCIHDPGAAHRSMHTRDFWRNSNLRFNWINLKEARDLKFKITYTNKCRYSRYMVLTIQLYYPSPNIKIFLILICNRKVGIEEAIVAYLYPISLADQYALSRRDFPIFAFFPIVSFVGLFLLSKAYKFRNHYRHFKVSARSFKP